jgi:hypothetical protein
LECQIYGAVVGMRALRRGAAPLVGVALVVLLGGCSRSTDPAAGGTATGRGSSLARPAAPVTHDLPADITTMLLPTTGAETRWSQGLDAFTRAVSYTAAVRCMRSRRVAVPQVPPPMFIRFFEIPDLAYLRARGFTGARMPLPDDLSTGSAPGRPDATAQQACLAGGAAAAKPLRDLFTPLQADWFRLLGTVPADPRVQDAVRVLPRCLAAHGLNVDDEDEFFAMLETWIHAHDGQLDAARLTREREFAKPYVDCMQPVEAAREPIRTLLRERFVAQHATELRQLRATLVPQIRQFEQRFTIQLSFPAP